MHVTKALATYRASLSILHLLDDKEEAAILDHQVQHARKKEMTE
jgi:hypothetical protein